MSSMLHVPIFLFPPLEHLSLPMAPCRNRVLLTAIPVASTTDPNSFRDPSCFFGLRVMRLEGIPLRKTSEVCSSWTETRRWLRSVASKIISSLVNWEGRDLE